MTGLRMARVRAIIPKVDAADVAFATALEAAQTNEDVTAAEAAYRVVLEEAVTALHEDTKHVNSLRTLRQIHLGTPHNPNRYPFGINPPTALRDLVRRMERLPKDAPVETA